MLPPPETLAHYLRRVVGVWRDDSRTDADLLAAFTAGEEAAFAALIGRHGATVWDACRRVLGDGPDAEDAFQAAFLALARHASQHRIDNPGAWLRRVAHRAALDAQRAARRRTRRERVARAAVTAATDEVVTEAEWRAILDEELGRLPERYRVPLALYYLEGRTQVEVGRLLRCSDRAVARRLVQGMDLLKGQMSRRGVTLTGTALAALFAYSTSVGAIPPRLLTETAALSVAFAAGPSVAQTPAVGLATRALAPRFSLWRGLVIVGLAAAVGTGLVLGQGPVAVREPNTVEPLTTQVVARPYDTDQSHSAVTGRVLDSEGQPVGGVAVSVLARRPFEPGLSGLHDDLVGAGMTAADGRFTVFVPAAILSRRYATLLVNRPGYARSTVPVPLVPAGRPTAPVKLQLTEGRPARGRVIGPDGRSLSGARVQVVRIGAVAREGVEDGPVPGGWPPPARTDSEGRFSFAGLGAERVWVRVEEEWCRPLTAILSARGDREESRYALAPARRVGGRVIASDTGLPVDFARVTVARADGYHPAVRTVSAYQALLPVWFPPLDHDTRTDSDGRFAAWVDDRRGYRIDIHPPDGSECLAVRREVPRRPAAEPADESIILPRGRVVEGRLLEAETGRPITGGVIYWESPPSADPVALVPGRESPVVSDRDGRFRLTVPHGPARLLAYAPGASGICSRVRVWSQGPDDTWSLRDTQGDETGGYAGVEVSLAFGDKPIRDLSVPLRLGRWIDGDIVGPEGERLEEATIVAAGRVAVSRSTVPLPFSAVASRYSLPGCEPGIVYPTFFFNADRDLGGSANLECGAAGVAGPRIRLQKCGAVVVRFTDAGLPAQFQHFPSLRLRLPRPYPVGARPDPVAADVADEWDLGLACRPDCAPVRSADGTVRVGGLIPGAEYFFWYRDARGRDGRTEMFRVGAGETIELAAVDLSGGPSPLQASETTPSVGPPEFATGPYEEK